MALSLHTVYGGGVGPSPERGALPVSLQMSLSRLNYEWPTYEVHLARMEGIAARLLCWQCGLTGWNEARQRVDRPPGERQERGRAGPQARAGPPANAGTSVPCRHRGPQI